MHKLKNLLINESKDFNVYFNSLLTLKLIEKLTQEKPVDYIINPKLKVGREIPYYDLSGALKKSTIKRTLQDLEDITLETETDEIIEYQFDRNASAKYWLIKDPNDNIMNGLVEKIGDVDNSIFAPLVVK